MTLDAFGEDAGWMARYAVSRDGEVVPWALVEQNIRATKPYEVFALRAMLAVSYFEKALYELPEDQVTPERVVALADEVEKRIQGGLSPRPLMSVPHILADEVRGAGRGHFFFFSLWARSPLRVAPKSDSEEKKHRAPSTNNNNNNNNNRRRPITTGTPSRRAPSTRTAPPSARCSGARTTWPIAPILGAWLTEGYFRAGNTRAAFCRWSRSSKARRSAPTRGWPSSRWT
jgi:hypothetical protein